MAKSKVQKKKLVKEYEAKIKEAKGFIVLKPNKLTPNEVSEFRKEIYDLGASFNVVTAASFFNDAEIICDQLRNMLSIKLLTFLSPP